jgi:hypothetical protein
MNKTTLALLCVIALLLGALAWTYREPLTAAIETKQTDEIKGEMKDTIESITAKIEAQDTKIKTEVVVVRETVREKVNALPADRVADGLNAELAVFRGMESSTGRLDGN